jgi:hypothetical protein
MKYTEFKKEAEKRDSVQKRQIAIQERTIDSLIQINSEYKNDVIPNYASENALLLEKLDAERKLNEVREERWKLKYQSLKSKRLGLSLYAGYGATLQNLQPSVGGAITFTVLRF